MTLPAVRLAFAGRAVDLTPPPGTPLAGYRARGDAVASGTLDPLEAILIRLRDPRPGGGEVIWVAIDVLAVDEALVASIAESVASATGSEHDAVIVCATHTHSAPSGWVRSLHPGVHDREDRAMRDELVRRVGHTARTLPDHEIPVRAILASGHAQGIGTNRTDPRGPHDSSLGALCLVDDQGAVRGVILDYASHATVLGHANRGWSADWPGAARRTLAMALEGTQPFPPGPAETAGGLDPASSDMGAERTAEPIVAFLQGAAGDASPRFVRRNQEPKEKERIGGLLAAQAATVIHEAETIDDASAQVQVIRTRVSLPTRPPISPAHAERLAADTERAWRVAERRVGAGSPLERIARTRHEGALMAAQFAAVERPATMDLPVSVVVIGDDAWLHLPVELYASYAAEIRAASPFRQTRVIGYADGYVGYVADEAAHRAQVYEALASPFDATGGRVLVEASIALLDRAHEAIRNESRQATKVLHA